MEAWRSGDDGLSSLCPLPPYRLAKCMILIWLLDGRLVSPHVHPCLQHGKDPRASRPARWGETLSMPHKEVDCRGDQATPCRILTNQGSYLPAYALICRIMRHIVSIKVTFVVTTVHPLHRPLQSAVTAASSDAEPEGRNRVSPGAGEAL